MSIDEFNLIILFISCEKLNSKIETITLQEACIDRLHVASIYVMDVCYIRHTGNVYQLPGDAI